MRYLDYIVRLAKEVKNPPLFLYHIYHYANKEVPYSLSKRIAKMNQTQYNKQELGDIIVNTHDGSNQVVHPDMDIFMDGVALICTPYPYAMEEYENPCLYIGNNLHALKPVMCPLDVQSRHTQGIHMSDPCLIADGPDLLCIYRETQYKDDYIFLKKVCIDNKGSFSVTKRHLLFFTKQEYVLSPAALLLNNELLIYHVKTNRTNSIMVLNRFDKAYYKKIATDYTEITGEPEDYYLWHIGICSSYYGKKTLHNESLKGLFLYINKTDNTKLKLFVADGCNLINWKIVKEVSLPHRLAAIIKFPYKSCINPQNGKILLSFRDKKSRNRLIELDV